MLLQLVVPAAWELQPPPPPPAASRRRKAKPCRAAAAAVKGGVPSSKPAAPLRLHACEEEKGVSTKLSPRDLMTMSAVLELLPQDQTQSQTHRPQPAKRTQ